MNAERLLNIAACWADLQLVNIKLLIVNIKLWYYT